MIAGKRHLHALWDYRLADLEVVITIVWSALDCPPQTADYMPMETLVERVGSHVWWMWIQTPTRVAALHSLQGRAQLWPRGHSRGSQPAQPVVCHGREGRQ